MFGIKEIIAMNNKEVTFDTKIVKACRDKCPKRCCINCDNFLSAEIDASKPGTLTDLCCLAFKIPKNTWSGTTACLEYIRAVNYNYGG